MTAASPDLVTFGESMALFMPQENRTLEHADSLQSAFGGAESNLAIGLARLGCSVGWCGALGDDPLGRRILKALRGEGVDVSRASLSGNAPTGLMFREEVAGRLAVHYHRRGSAASGMTPGHLDTAYLQSARMLHVTGITMALSNSARESVLHAMRIAKEAGVKISFDPNLRLKLWSIEEAREALLPAAELADYFLPGWDELKLLYDTEDEGEILDRVGALDATTVIKSKGDGSLLLQGGSSIFIPFYPAEKVVDTVGAGDGFCSGFLAGILKGMTPEDAVRLGSICGSLAVQGRGDWESLPDWQAARQRLDNSVWVER
ncbi:sugar kinase [Paenibacillus herberti]|uniref:2-dehydro-3-deoxygluconokinase n=1 Tax=Paenibacillus herberti TaxID=1619309 RepID=A0A229NZ41_9BACL|nr:sugar kinase [Paenibacillus herberti]OXM15306.1 2-dehydro-3-deoxygluconokinase [Paenibacillus herberti]